MPITENIDDESSDQVEASQGQAQAAEETKQGVPTNILPDNLLA